MKLLLDESAARERKTASELGSLNGKLAFAQRRISALAAKEAALSKELQQGKDSREHRSAPASPSRRSRELAEIHDNAVLLDMTTKLLDAKRDVEALRNELETTRRAAAGDFQAKERALSAKDTEISELTAALARSTADVTTIRSQLSQAETAVAAANSRTSELLDALSRGNSSTESLHQELRTAQSELDTLRSARREDKQAAAARENELSALRSSLAEATTMMSALESELRRAKEQSVSQASTVASLRTQVSAATQERSELSELEAACLSLAASSADVQQKLDDMTAGWNADKARWAEELSQWRHKASLSATEAAEYKLREAAVKSAWDESVRHLQSVQSALQSVEAMSEQQRAQLSTMESHLRDVSVKLALSLEREASLQESHNKLLRQVHAYQLAEASEQRSSSRPTSHAEAQTEAPKLPFVHIAATEAASPVTAPATSSSTVPDDIGFACAELISSFSRGRQQLAEQLSRLIEAMQGQGRFATAGMTPAFTGLSSPPHRDHKPDFLSPPQTPAIDSAASFKEARGGAGHAVASFVEQLKEATAASEYGFLSLLQLCHDAAMLARKAFKPVSAYTIECKRMLSEFDVFAIC